MQTIRYKSRGTSVGFLQELLFKLGYTIPASSLFDKLTDTAVKDFQMRNSLVVDGIVGIKTWTILLSQANLDNSRGEKFLSELDLQGFSQQFEVELAAVKAVNEVESCGQGFLLDGKPKILFEGHIFWRELSKRGISPDQYISQDTENILYKNWVKKYYSNGSGEYLRLQKGIELISGNQEARDAANSSASWGCFQIMGFHAKPLGYDSVDDFVDKMHLHEREHLTAFGKYIQKNGCLRHLRDKNWASFAKCYNGPAYAKNRYDEKMANAYKKYSKN
jgi:hypothetical protein